jgi:hemolysin activation/secretion protein
LDGTLTYPLRRIEAQTIQTSVNLNYKNLDDKVNSTSTDTPKNASSVTVGVRVRDERNLLGFHGETTASILLTAGNLSITDSTAAALDAAGANTQGSYQKMNLVLSRTSLLPAGFSLFSSLTAQRSFANKNLDGSERMAVSGSSAVKSYPSGELIGTNATQVSFELSHPLPALAQFKNSLQLFIDWGQANEPKPLAGQSTREISDLGIGWSGSYKAMFVKAQLAHRLESTPAISEPTSQNNFLMQLGYLF